MLKCKIDKATGLVKVKAGGDLRNLTVEVLALVHEVYLGIEQQNPEAAKEFRNTLIGILLNPKGPMWKEEAEAAMKKEAEE